MAHFEFTPLYGLNPNPMAAERWLEKGFTIDNALKIKDLLAYGSNWQIYSCDSGHKILLAAPELLKKWTDKGLIDKALFQSLNKIGRSFYVLKGEGKFFLCPADGVESPRNKAEGMAFAHALRETRLIDGESSLHDAIYIEHYVRLLPSWSMTPRLEDDVVLGKWITGGVEISALSFRRLCCLTGWLAPKDLAQIVETAGFDVSPQLSRLALPSTRQENEAKVTPAYDKFTLPGRPKLEAFFNEHVIDIVMNLEKYSRLGIEFPSAIVLHGPPGSGKTYAVERLVEFLDWPGFYIESKSVGSPYIHETSRKIAAMFDKAMAEAPSVLIIDEMEAFLSERDSSKQYQVEEVAEFLRRIPVAVKNRVLVLAMTNMLHTIDPAVLRRGRFDHVIEVGMPSREEVAAVLQSILSKLPTADDLNLEVAVAILTGRPLSDADFFSREAARLAARHEKTMVDQESIDTALKKIADSGGEKSTRIGF